MPPMGGGGGGDVDGTTQAMLLELAVEVVEHDAGFDVASSVFGVERDDAVEVF